MLFSSPIFIFLFLPVVLFLIVISPKKLHNFILLTASLIFYAWGSVSHTLIFIFSILFNYVFGLGIDKASGNNRKKILTIAVTINLVLLGYCKYYNFFLDNVNSLLSGFGKSSIEYQKVALPIGISFFTFHALSYIIDVYRRRVSAQRNLLDLALYISFFPQLIAGPIVRYIDVATQFQARMLNMEKAAAGIHRFIFGLAKKVIIANTMALTADQIFVLPIAKLSPALAWLGIIAYTLQIYFDFSGYSDMALGLAKIFGFSFPENFNYPYVAQSIKEFWRRWHISLSTWFRDFLYIPLGGSRGSEMRTLLNLLIVFFCTGFWHGASWTFVIWGLFHGTFLLIERVGLEKILIRTWKPVRVVYTLLVVIVGWVFFRIETLPKAIDYIIKMSFMPSDSPAQFFLMEYLDTKIIAVLVIAILYSIRAFRNGNSFFERALHGLSQDALYQTFFQTCKVVISVVLFFVTVSYLASGTYNPFIYFRF